MSGFAGVGDLARRLDAERTGRELHALAAELYPIPRSITGDGVRRTLEIIGRSIDLVVQEVPSGTRVLDWTVPPEWNVREAWIRDPRGAVVVDFADSSLHLIGYSMPVHASLHLAELSPRLHSIPEHPDWIPYKTSYYQETWGFCLPHAQLSSLVEGEYEVRIDSILEPGSLTYGECIVRGATDDEVIISAHVCHPALCNDNLSGVVVARELARQLGTVPLRHTYRFVFAPGTIGAITWLAANRERLDRVRAGLVLTGVGDRGATTYKRSRRGDALVDRTLIHVLAHGGAAYSVVDFSPLGYDERQYCSPGFDLPVGCLMRSPFGTYPEYHTSADDLEFVTPASLADSLATCLTAVAVLEGNETLVNLQPYGEPQLGRRGLFRRQGGRTDRPTMEAAFLWVLNLSDGEHDLLAIAERAGLPFDVVRAAADTLLEHDLLGRRPSSAP
jgi:aminopeptidase-like protein